MTITQAERSEPDCTLAGETGKWRSRIPGWMRGQTPKKLKGFGRWCRSHWPVVFTFIAVAPMAAFNFAVSVLSFNASAYTYGAAFALAGLVLLSIPPAVV